MYLKQFINGTAKKPSHDVILVIGQKPVNDLSAYLMYVKLSGGKSASQLLTLVSGLSKVQGILNTILLKGHLMNYECPATVE